MIVAVRSTHAPPPTLSTPAAIGTATDEAMRAMRADRALAATRVISLGTSLGATEARTTP